jgi:hypothetical protein
MTLHSDDRHSTAGSHEPHHRMGRDSGQEVGGQWAILPFRPCLPHTQKRTQMHTHTQVHAQAPATGDVYLISLSPVQVHCDDPQLFVVVQVYSQWNRHFGESLAVYDELIATYPEDYR